jgi:hypothetical protein
MIYIVALIGAVSATFYLRRRAWIDAVLALAAAAALAAIAGDFSLPDGGRTVAIDPGAAVQAIDDAAAITLAGDGLRAAQWHDLPARPLKWQAPAGDVLRLDFPRQLALGRMFTLTVRRDKPSAARLQLLAENGQVIAEASGAGAQIGVQWLPPVAETLVLKARLLDGAGKVVAQGPIPLQVREAAPLMVQGRFGAPSFDVRALGDLLANSHALLDWQVTLGKTVTRSETAPAPIATPNLLLIDTAWFEHQPEAARSALLAQVAQGTPLIVLGAGAADKAVWSRQLQLELKPQPENRQAGAPLAMAVAALNPGASAAGAWTGSDDQVWTRSWGKGRIAWLGVGEWHRYAISEPQALALWWQGVLDRAGVQRIDDVLWEEPQEMPLPGQRLALCARGVRGDAVFTGLQQSVAWQRRPDKADASCVAVWPRTSGWLTVETQGAKPHSAVVYVFDRADWPMWQAAQRRDATAHYAARTPQPPAQGRRPLPAWPFGVLFVLALLALWWRERR